MGRQHPVEADQVQPRSCYPCGEALHEFLRRHHDVRAAVAIGASQLQHDLAFAIAAQPLVGEPRTSDGAAQSIERLALMAGDAHGCVQAQAVRLAQIDVADFGDEIRGNRKRSHTRLEEAEILMCPSLVGKTPVGNGRTIRKQS